MAHSPFTFGSTVSTHAFTNREAECEKLIKNLTSSINTMLISPRRWGKSSLVEKVTQTIKTHNKDIRVVTLDLFSCADEKEFLEMFAREVIKASANKLEEWITIAKTFFKQLTPKLSVGVDPNSDLSLSFDIDEISKFSEEILNLPEVISNKKNIKIIICLDEFQSLSSFKNYESLERKMRAAWQKHKKTTYCLYGSKRHMMAEIFNNPSKPFYRFGDVIMLQKIAEKKWIEFIVARFKKTGKNISEEEAQRIAVLMKNHPWYVQQLALYTWNLTKTTATAKEIKNALLEVLSTNTPFYEKEIEGLSRTQVAMLKAVTAGEKQFTSVRVMQKYSLGTPQNIRQNKTVLINKDIIDKTESDFQFLDPAFEIWFRRNFLHE